MNTTSINCMISKKAPDKKLLGQIQAALFAMEKRLLPFEMHNMSMQSELRRILSSGGKRLRPVLAYLCYRMSGGREREILPLMCMLELMHTASLIHDDVVDGGTLRRGQATINETSGNETAVQCGDFLLAKAMQRLRYYKGTGINEELVNVSTQMCIGELQQLTIRHDPDKQTRQAYFSQIYKKTAALIAASCYTGALAGGMEEDDAARLKEYGENLGIAFQLCDDLLDFSARSGFGKKTGQDIKSGVFTLPVIYLLEKGVPDPIRLLLEKRNKNPEEIQSLTDYVETTDALEYTKTMVCRRSAAAVAALGDFPNSPEKEALVTLAKSLSDREI